MRPGFVPCPAAVEGGRGNQGAGCAVSPSILLPDADEVPRVFGIDSDPGLDWSVVIMIRGRVAVAVDRKWARGGYNRRRQRLNAPAHGGWIAALDGARGIYILSGGARGQVIQKKERRELHGSTMVIRTGVRGSGGGAVEPLISTFSPDFAFPSSSKLFPFSGTSSFPFLTEPRTRTSVGPGVNPTRLIASHT